MSCLEATFTLTPQSPLHFVANQNYAALNCYGADFDAGPPTDFSSLYTTNRFYFEQAFASDPNLDYTQWANLKIARFLWLTLDLTTYAGTQKQLALVFGFDVYAPGWDGRVLVYSNAKKLSDQTLIYGDNQFLLEIESLDQPLYLYFIHAGGFWFCKGISGYLV